jgi:hypothetical protein
MKGLSRSQENAYHFILRREQEYYQILFNRVGESYDVGYLEPRSE